MCMRTNTLLIVIFTLLKIISSKDKKTFEGCLLSTGAHSVVVRSFFFLFLFFTIGPCSKDLNLQVISFQKIKC